MDQIEIGGLVMEGTFGKIMHGELKCGNEEASVKVFVKTVSSCASKEQTDLMMREACAFRNLKHKNLQSILGVCLDDEKKPMALFSLCEVGNLKKYLLSLNGLSKNELRLSNPDTIDQVGLFVNLNLCF
jgi:serine/threonine protein kinase